MNQPLDILKEYWNYNEFREPQEAIINTALNGESSLVLLPTSSGKSICYQIPALLLDGVCVVISPLIALIQDQVQSLKSKNIKAIALTSQLSQEETIVAFDNLQFGGCKFVYLSPEKLQSKFIQDKIKQLNVSLIAIDEAHCISEWGHDFRPAYLELKILKDLQPDATFMALTATATDKVLKDIEVQLELKKPTIFRKSFFRKNLAYYVIQTEDIYSKLIQILNKFEEPTVVYTNNRKQTKEISSYLNRNSFKSSFYHGGLSSQEKNIAFENWMSEKIPIMVATNAFGMGIDKANVRAVIHISTPNSLENYIQESGRAGRDGKDSFAIMLSNASVRYEIENKFYLNLADSDYVKSIYYNLSQFYKIALGELTTTPFNFSLQEFCAQYKLNLLKTYNALKILERENIILLDENYSRKSMLKFIVSSSQLFDYLKNNPSKEALSQVILRSHGGIFEHFTIINEYILSKKLGVKKNEVIQGLKDLHEMKIVDYSFANTNSRLSFLVVREDNYTINRISKNIKQQNNLKIDKLKSVIDFVKNDQVCRNIQLQNYFNEHISKPCGKCDVCTKKKVVSSERISSEILELLKTTSLSSFKIVELMNYSDEEILISLKLLLEQGKITITSQNKYKVTIE